MCFLQISHRRWSRLRKYEGERSNVSLDENKAAYERNNLDFTTVSCLSYLLGSLWGHWPAMAYFRALILLILFSSDSYADYCTVDKRTGKGH